MHVNVHVYCSIFAGDDSGVARGGAGGGGASAPGRRPEGGAKILPRNFLKFI